MVELGALSKPTKLDDCSNSVFTMRCAEGSAAAASSASVAGDELHRQSKIPPNGRKSTTSPGANASRPAGRSHRPSAPGERGQQVRALRAIQGGAPVFDPCAHELVEPRRLGVGVVQRDRHAHEAWRVEPGQRAQHRTAQQREDDGDRHGIARQAQKYARRRCGPAVPDGRDGWTGARTESRRVLRRWGARDRDRRPTRRRWSATDRSSSTRREGARSVAARSSVRIGKVVASTACAAAAPPASAGWNRKSVPLAADLCRRRACAVRFRSR